MENHLIGWMRNKDHVTFEWDGNDETRDTLTCRSQNAGGAATCVYWSFYNAYAGLARGLPRRVQQYNDLPKRWWVYFRACITPIAEGVKLKDAAAKLKNERIGGGVQNYDERNPEDVGIYFHPPVYEDQVYNKLSSLELAQLNSRLVWGKDEESNKAFYKGEDIQYLCQKFVDQTNAEVNSDYLTVESLGINYVAIMLFKNYFYDMATVSRNNFVKMVPRRTLTAHAVVLFHISDNHLWYWDTEYEEEDVSPVKIENEPGPGTLPDDKDGRSKRPDYDQSRQKSCLRCISFDDLAIHHNSSKPAAQRYTSGVSELMFIALNESGVHARDYKPPPRTCYRWPRRNPLPKAEPDPDGEVWVQFPEDDLEMRV